MKTWPIDPRAPAGDREAVALVSDAEADAGYRAWFEYWDKECPGRNDEYRSANREFCRTAIRRVAAALSRARAGSEGER